jgi:hypothetical protein
MAAEKTWHDRGRWRQLLAMVGVVTVVSGFAGAITRPNSMNGGLSILLGIGMLLWAGFDHFIRDPRGTASGLQNGRDR